MNVETLPRKGYGSRVGDESTLQGEREDHTASINFNAIEHQTIESQSANPCKTPGIQEKYSQPHD